MTVIIIISTFELAIDSPLSDNNTPFQYILTAIDKSLTSVFVFESCAKIISYGFIWCGSKSYLRSGWNVLDFFVILITVILNFINVLDLILCDDLWKPKCNKGCQIDKDLQTSQNSI